MATINKKIGVSPILHNNQIDNNKSFIHDGASPNEQPDKTYKFVDLLAVPNWTMDAFIAERQKFVTHGIGDSLSGFSEPGTFFYKVFFNFNTSFGLLGSLVLDTNGKAFSDVNSAWQYLTNNINGSKFSERYRKILKRKRTNLENFGKLLNFLTLECPWFFSEIAGLHEILKLNDFNEICGKEKKSFTLKFNQDAIDMRVSTLIDLYRDACFDYTNFKEVIPENLRMFDMCIVLCAPPTTGLNVYKKAKGVNVENVYGKTQFGGNADDLMSFKCVICKNCEILYKELVGIGDVINNAEGSKIDACEFKIAVDRAYLYTLNDELNVEILDGLFRAEDTLEDKDEPTPTEKTKENPNTKTANSADTKKSKRKQRQEEKQKTLEQSKKDIKKAAKDYNVNIPDDELNNFLNSKSNRYINKMAANTKKNPWDAMGDLVDDYNASKKKK